MIPKMIWLPNSHFMEMGEEVEMDFPVVLFSDKEMEDSQKYVLASEVDIMRKELVGALQRANPFHPIHTEVRKNEALIKKYRGPE